MSSIHVECKIKHVFFKVYFFTYDHWNDVTCMSYFKMVKKLFAFSIAREKLKEAYVIFIVVSTASVDGLRYWPFVWGIRRSPVNSPHKGQWRGALLFSLICTQINGWVNNHKAGDLRRHGGHYEVTVIPASMCSISALTLLLLKPEYSVRTRSAPWLLMTWLLVSPGHQQQWYWLCMINVHVSYTEGLDPTISHHWASPKFKSNERYFRSRCIVPITLRWCWYATTGIRQYGGCRCLGTK